MFAQQRNKPVPVQLPYYPYRTVKLVITLVIIIVLYLKMNNEKPSILESERQIHDTPDIDYSA